MSGCSEFLREVYVRNGWYRLSEGLGQDDAARLLVLPVTCSGRGPDSDLRIGHAAASVLQCRGSGSSDSRFLRVQLQHLCGPRNGLLLRLLGQDDLACPIYRPIGLRRSGHRSGSRIAGDRLRSEEHTSELQSQSNLVCRLLLEKKKPTIS